MAADFIVDAAAGYRYWTGSVFYNAPNFYAVEVDIQTGQDSWTALVTDITPRGFCMN
jgi:hypothetical protein